MDMKQREGRQLKTMDARKLKEIEEQEETLWRLAAESKLPFGVQHPNGTSAMFYDEGDIRRYVECMYATGETEFDWDPEAYSELFIDSEGYFRGEDWDGEEEDA